MCEDAEGEGTKEHQLGCCWDGGVLPKGIELVDYAPCESFATFEIGDGVEWLLAEVYVLVCVSDGSAVS